jgi:glycine/D-amino acid oxidase-like deaminating enzyme
VLTAATHGASTAFHLAANGLQVAIVETKALAAGATGTSSALVRVHYTVAEGRAAGVRTSHGEISTAVVVIAAGNGSRRLCAGLDFDLPVWPFYIKTALLRTEIRHRRCRKQDGCDSATSRTAFEHETAAHQPHELLGDGKSQAGAARPAGTITAPRLVRPKESVRRLRKVLGRYALAGIDDAQPRPLTVPIDGDLDGSLSRRVLQGVVDEGAHDLTEPPEVRLAPHRLDHRVQVDVSLIGQRSQLRDHLLSHVGQGNRFER